MQKTLADAVNNMMNHAPINGRIGIFGKDRLRQMLYSSTSE
jgi:hypothetical protein